MWGRLKPLYISPYYDLGYINTCTNIQVSGSAGQNGRIVMDLALTVASWKYGWAADTEEEGGARIFSVKLQFGSPIVAMTILLDRT